ncbi:hypothetical protein [uncultured Corynebacterium sp.]|nr:hypothetical protein [uncultured Corynebacterium sp.]
MSQHRRLSWSTAKRILAALSHSTVTYYWDGSKVAHEGRIPNTNL